MPALSRRSGQARPGRPITLQTRIALAFTAVILVTGLMLVLFLNITLERSLAQNPALGTGPSALFVIVKPGPTSQGPYLSLSYPGIPTGLYQVTTIAGSRLSQVLATEAVQRLTSLSILAILGLAAVAFAVSYLLARRTTRPVTEMAALVTALTPNDLTPRLAVGTTSDELAQLAGAFNSMLDRLQSAFTDISLFNAYASHELRTSLALVRTHLEVGLATREYEGAVCDALGATSRLAQQVDDMLALAARETTGRRNPPVPEPVDLALLAAEVADTYGRAGNRVELELPDELPPCRGQAVWLQRAIANLVDNALKYGPAGAPVTIRLEQRFDAVLLHVHDRGPGIPPDQLERIWERFARLPAAEDGKGFGLGLALVRQAAESAGGIAWVDSSPERGTTFTLSLPLYADFMPCLLS